MKGSRSIVGIAVGVSSVVLIVAGVIAHRSVRLLADTSDEILRSKELELSLERLLSSLRDAETGQRGYLLTQRELGLLVGDPERDVMNGADAIDSGIGLGIDDDIVRYACGLFDGPKCVGLAEASGSCHVTADDGTPVDLAAALEPFRLRG